MTANRILVCDPDPQLQRALRVILGRVGYTTLAAASAADALVSVAREPVQAVIVELELPDLDGIELCQRLRARVAAPILVLSRVADEGAKIDALQSGADDYLTKPFSPGELIARLAARLRSAPAALRYESDGLVIDLAAHTVTVDGEQVHLTPTEFALLRVLATSTGPVAPLTLAAQIWGPPRNDVGPRVRTHIANLRAKLERANHPDLIRTEVGLGYRFSGAARTAP
jgi:two-component system, OmpR family, KDP operon response regulator KdpE